MEQLRERWAGARRVLVLTGAGVSAESGIPTFRGAGGWYRERRAEELASLAGFQHDPQLVWEWYDYRRQLIGRAEPNAAHQAIADWQQQGKDVVVVTQNVDDLHERAGTRDAVHVHGSIWRVRCFGRCGVIEDRRVPLPELPPRCECGELLRPDVVWFGELLPHDEITKVETALCRPFDLAFVVGTEAVFGYIQEWALRAQRLGALLVEVNPGDTVLSPLANVRLRGPAAAVLPNLIRS